jgi:hypothetical protein
MKSSLCLLFSIAMLLGTSGNALTAQDFKEVMAVVILGMVVVVELFFIG